MSVSQVEATKVGFPKDKSGLTKVHQAIEPNFLAKLPIPWPQGYELVAYADVGDAPGHAFALTNSIEKPWFETGDPRLEVVKKARSTSVGDILEDADGVLYLIEPCGHKILDEGDYS